MKERGNNTWITGNSALPFLSHQIIYHITWNLHFNKWSHFLLFITKNSRGLSFGFGFFFSFSVVTLFVLLGKIIWHFFKSWIWNNLTGFFRKIREPSLYEENKEKTKSGITEWRERKYRCKLLCNFLYYV